MKEEDSPPVLENVTHFFYKMSTKNTDSIMVSVIVNNKELQMEVYTYASASVIIENMYIKLWGGGGGKENSTLEKHRKFVSASQWPVPIVIRQKIPLL